MTTKWRAVIVPDYMLEVITKICKRAKIDGPDGSFLVYPKGTIDPAFEDKFYYILEGDTKEAAEAHYTRLMVIEGMIR